VLPHDLHAALKKAAIDEHRKMKELVEDAVRAYLEKTRRTRSRR
jgi:hypothetical protein